MGDTAQALKGGFDRAGKTLEPARTRYRLLRKAEGADRTFAAVAREPCVNVESRHSDNINPEFICSKEDGYGPTLTNAATCGFRQ
jgi:hypothetical protein